MDFIKDTLYDQPLGTLGAFRFDENVARVFPDMIQRSVPGYTTIVAAIGALARRFAQNGSVCYDLGCSLGAAALSMYQTITAEDCRIIAVDNSPAMIERCRATTACMTLTHPIDWQCADLREVIIANASVVVLNFTLQFIPLTDRLPLLTRIYHGTRSGGVLILSEKLCFDDPRQQQLHEAMHEDFKRAHGYSDLAISQKRTALENVLVPETFAVHRQRLHEAGYSSVEIWFQYFNFVSMIALK